MLWQKSAQYQGMPHQQYMQTGEGKRANQAFANWNTQMQGRPSASGFGGQPATSQRPVYSKGNSYSPGKAQPMQMPSYGSPYGQKRPTIHDGNGDGVDDRLAKAGLGKPPQSAAAASQQTGAVSPSSGAVSMPAYSQAPTQAPQPPAPKPAAQQPKAAPQSPGMAQPISPASTGTPYGTKAPQATAASQSSAPSPQQLINKQRAFEKLLQDAGPYASQFVATYGPPSAAWLFPSQSWGDSKEIFDSPHSFFEKVNLAKNAGFLDASEAAELDSIRQSWIQAGRDGQNTEAWQMQNVAPRLTQIGEKVMGRVGGGGQAASGMVAPAPQQPQMGGVSYGQQPDGNLAYAPPDQRPPPFQAAYGQIGGGYSSQPNAGQRDAFISNINNQLGQMQQQSWASPGSVGAPQFNFGQMWGQAGDMVQQGWKNPLAGLFG